MNKKISGLLCVLLSGIAFNAAAASVDKNAVLVEVCNATGDDGYGHNAYDLDISLDGKNQTTLKFGECFKYNVWARWGVHPWFGSVGMTNWRILGVTPRGGIISVTPFNLITTFKKEITQIRSVALDDIAVRISSGKDFETGSLPDKWSIGYSVTDQEHPSDGGVWMNYLHGFDGALIGDNDVRDYEQVVDGIKDHEVPDYDKLSADNFEKGTDTNCLLTSGGGSYNLTAINTYGGFLDVFPKDPLPSIRLNIQSSTKVFEDVVAGKKSYCQNNRIVGGDWWKTCHTQSAATMDGHTVTAQCNDGLGNYKTSTFDANVCPSHQLTNGVGVLRCKQ